MSACSKCGVEIGHASGLGSPCVMCGIESGDWDPAPVDAFRATHPGPCPDPIPDDIQEELTQLRARVRELEIIGKNQYTSEVVASCARDALARIKS